MLEFKSEFFPFFPPCGFFIFKNFRHLLPSHYVHLTIFSRQAKFLFFDVNSAYGVVFSVPFFVSLFISFNVIFLASAFLKFSKKTPFFPLFLGAFRRLSRAVSFGHYSVIQFVGFRYRQRWFRKAHLLKFRLGYNSKVWFKTPSDFASAIRKISPKKRTHFYFSFQLAALRWLIHAIYHARPATLYKGRGVNIKEQPMVLHEGKKAIW